jgi:branched-chain amino acid transport system ATP-binding protein
VLEVEDLRVSYGKARAVRGVALSVSPGRITLVLGPNGAGKTTTLRAISGLLKPATGRVILDGADITRQPPHLIVRRGISMVPEGRKVFAPLTVLENLRLGGYTASRGARAANLRQVFSMFPVLADRRQQQAGLLSGGQQQMLAFGRALMAEPRFMLMDEPSMGLAPVVIDQIMASVRQIADSGIGVLMVEQNAEAGLGIADEVVVMSRGEMTFSGPVDQARAEEAISVAFLGVPAPAEHPEQ